MPLRPGKQNRGRNFSELMASDSPRGRKRNAQSAAKRRAQTWAIIFANERKHK